MTQEVPQKRNATCSTRTSQKGALDGVFKAISTVFQAPLVTINFQKT